MLFLVAACGETMQPETGYPIETSSNPGDKPGLSDPAEDPWTPDESDESPTVTITVDDEDTYIESIKITETDNVESVTITVIDEDGNEVSSTTVSPTDGENVFETPVDEDGSKIVITFTPTDPSKPIAVGPIETTACAELGTSQFVYNIYFVSTNWILPVFHSDDLYLNTKSIISVCDCYNIRVSFVRNKFSTVKQHKQCSIIFLLSIRLLLLHFIVIVIHRVRHSK
jgi:hypothetical protein